MSKQQPIEAFEETLRNRSEGVSAYTVRDYTASLKKFAEWFEMTNGEAMYGGPLCQDTKWAWRKVHSPFVSRG